MYVSIFSCVLRERNNQQRFCSPVCGYLALEKHYRQIAQKVAYVVGTAGWGTCVCHWTQLLCVIYISLTECVLEMVTNRSIVSTVPNSGLPWYTTAVHHSLQSLGADEILLFSNSQTAYWSDWSDSGVPLRSPLSSMGVE